MYNHRSILRSADKFRRELHYDFSFENIKVQIEKQGYSVALIGSCDGDRLIRQLELSAHRDKQAFTYQTQLVKTIFLQASLSVPDKVHLLLHEIGHIKLGHLERGKFELDSQDAEAEAEAFASCVLVPSREYKVMLVFSLVMLFAMALCALNLGCWRGFFAFHEGLYSGKESQIISTANETSCTEEEPETEPFNLAEERSEDEDQSQTVYITQSGRRYHRETCYYACNNSHAMTVEEAEAFGCSPCAYCFHDKIN